MKIGEQSHFALGSVNGPSGNDGLATGFAWAVDNAALVDLLPDGTDPAKVIVRSKSTPGTATLTLSAKNSAGATISGTHSVTVDKPAPPAATSLTVAEGITEPIPPAPPPPSAGVIPVFPMSTAYPDWQNYTGYVREVYTGQGRFFIGIVGVIHVWANTGKTNDAARDWCLDEFRTQLAASMAKWNAKQILDEFCRDSYLYAFDQGFSWMLVLNWLGSFLTAQEIADASMILEQCCWNITHPDKSNWNGTPQPWTGWALNNPLNNYWYRSRYAMILAWAIHTKSQTWLDQVNLWLPTVRQLWGHAVGGGSFEGTGYGLMIGSFFWDVWLTKTALGIDLSADVRVTDHLEYFTRFLTPDLKSFPAIGDFDRNSYWDRNISVLGTAVMLAPDSEQARHARWVLNRAHGDGALPRVVRPESAWACCFDPVGPEVEPPHDTYFAAGVGELFARDAAGNFLCVKAGVTVESHDHNNAGEFQLYVNGHWEIASAIIFSQGGVEHPVKYHNCLNFFAADGTAIEPLTRGFDQNPPVMQWTDDGNLLTVKIDLKKSYPTTADIVSYVRSLAWDRAARKLTVHDLATVQNGVTCKSQFTIPTNPSALTIGGTGTQKISKWADVDPSVTWKQDAWLVERSGATDYTVEISW